MCLVHADLDGVRDVAENWPSFLSLPFGGNKITRFAEKPDLGELHVYCLARHYSR